MKMILIGVGLIIALVAGAWIDQHPQHASLRTVCDREEENGGYYTYITMGQTSTPVWNPTYSCVKSHTVCIPGRDGSKECK